MDWELFCEEQAQECERLAAELGGKANTDWLQMAEDWRRMAEEPAPPFSIGLKGGAALAGEL